MFMSQPCVCDGVFMRVCRWSTLFQRTSAWPLNSHHAPLTARCFSEHTADRARGTVAIFSRWDSRCGHGRGDERAMTDSWPADAIATGCRRLKLQCFKHDVLMNTPPHTYKRPAYVVRTPITRHHIRGECVISDVHARLGESSSHAGRRSSSSCIWGGGWPACAHDIVELVAYAIVELHPQSCVL
jgi:hypothetical protein